MNIRELNENLVSIIDESSESEEVLVDRVEKFLLKHLETADKTLKRLEDYKNPPHNLEIAQAVYSVIKGIVEDFRKEFK